MRFSFADVGAGCSWYRRQQLRARLKNGTPRDHGLSARVGHWLCVVFWGAAFFAIKRKFAQRSRRVLRVGLRCFNCALGASVSHYELNNFGDKANNDKLGI